MRDVARCRTVLAVKERALELKTAARKADGEQALLAKTRGLLLVLEGAVLVRVGTHEETLWAGDSADFRSDGPHAYVDESGRKRARFALTVFQPGVGSEARR